MEGMGKGRGTGELGRMEGRGEWGGLSQCGAGKTWQERWDKIATRGSWTGLGGVVGVTSSFLAQRKKLWKCLLLWYNIHNIYHFKHL